MSIVLQLAYDGTPFFGWQKTKEGPSIEESLEKALFEILQHEVVLQAASRTDRGVHAKGQVAHFNTHRNVDPKKLLLGLNALLPPEIRVLNAAHCSPSFHPTLDVAGKEYRYTLALGVAHNPLYRHLAWHVPKFQFGQDVVDAIPHLVGERDFKAFCNERKGITYSSTVRNLQLIDLEEKEGILIFSLVGNHFLYKMARNLVGLLVQIGEGKFDKDKIPDLFAKGIRKEGAMTAPAHGLCLEKVFYPADNQPFAS